MSGKQERGSITATMEEVETAMALIANERERWHATHDDTDTCIICEMSGNILTSGPLLSNIVQVFGPCTTDTLAIIAITCSWYFYAGVLCGVDKSRSKSFQDFMASLGVDDADVSPTDPS